MAEGEETIGKLGPGDIEKLGPKDLPEGDQEMMQSEAERVEGAEEEPTEKSPEEIEAEKEATEKILALGHTRDLMAHGTYPEYLNGIAQHGIVPLTPKFTRKMSQGEFWEYRVKRETATGESVQGEQSVSVLDPWKEIELLEAIAGGQDYQIYAIPTGDWVSGAELDYWKERRGRIVVPDEKDMAETNILEKVKNIVPGIEGNIRDIYLAPFNGFHGSKDIVHGNFKLRHDYLLKYRDDSRSIDDLKKDETVLENLTNQWANGCTLIIKLSQDDIEKGRVIRFNTESCIENRVPVNKIVGILPNEHLRIKDEITNEDIKMILDFAKQLKIPVYNVNGDIVWPKQMSYEEVKAFVAERDKNRIENQEERIEEKDEESESGE